jgi:hypothetical protein
MRCFMCEVILLSRTSFRNITRSLLILFYYILLSMKTIKVTFLNNTIYISKNLIEKEPHNSIDYIKQIVIDKINLNVKLNELFIILPSKSKLLTNNILNNNLSYINEIEVIQKQKGGMAIALFAVFIVPMIMTGKGFMRLAKVIVDFFKMFAQMMQIIPLIFDPPAFINDVMFGVSWGINKIFSRAMDSITESAKSPEKDDTDTSPFGENGDQGRMTCADPTLGMILLLVVCPPLAIFYKMGIAGMVSAIICGVLCVKLYYFPGLLFAILHVLC